VIMCSHFGDFVSKRHTRSTSHLAIMTKKPFPEVLILKHSLSILENFKLPQTEPRSSLAYSSRSRPNVFHINLNFDGDGTSTDFNLENLSFYHSYEIPLSFRGMKKVR